jgi:hypothetical protein
MLLDDGLVNVCGGLAWLLLPWSACSLAGSVRAVWSTPEDGTDGAAMAAISFFFLSLASLASAFTCAVALILVRRQSSQHRNNAASPAWYPDPWGAANRRWWDGHSWTGWTG